MAGDGIPTVNPLRDSRPVPLWTHRQTRQDRSVGWRKLAVSADIKTSEYMRTWHDSLSFCASKMADDWLTDATPGQEIVNSFALKGNLSAQIKDELRRLNRSGKSKSSDGSIEK
jgi:hypothetical protein